MGSLPARILFPETYRERAGGRDSTAWELPLENRPDSVTASSLGQFLTSSGITGPLPVALV